MSKGKPVNLGEVYYVRVQYKKPDGYWITEELKIQVPIIDRAHEKDQHDMARFMAAEFFRRRRVEFVVKGVVYV